MIAKQKEEVSVVKVSKGELNFCVRGTTPLICNRMSEKAKQQLLMPPGRKTAADKASTLKHYPMQEYRDSPYKSKNPSNPTLLVLPSGMFKGCIANAALDMPGAKKTQIGRLVGISGFNIDVYGIPQIFMSIVRSSDINHTPDVRTRAILPEWACRVTVTYVTPLLREQPVINLFGAAGMMIGIGDYRSEKGKGNFGSFELVNSDDPDFLRIIAEGGRKEQEEAMQNPLCYDDETDDLLAWYNIEANRRGFKVAA